VPARVQTWKRHSAQLVGWFPRLALPPRGHRKSLYLSKHATLLWHGRYSIIVTKGAVMHARYLAAYSEEMPQAVRDMVVQKRNCEDLAMQFLVSSMTAADGAAPAFVWDPACVPCSAAGPT
jgi:glycogenin